MRTRLFALIVGLCFFFPASSKADTMYSFTDTADGYSWSFDVPSIITTDTTIMSFLTTHLGAGMFANNGCTTIHSVNIDPTTDIVQTNFLGGGACTTGLLSSIEFSVPIDVPGTIIAGAVTFTISQAPEPSSLLLLASGVAGLGFARRRFLRD